MDYLWVAIGGALGSVARYGGSIWVARWSGDPFPWGTLVVNVVGSFVIGAVMAIASTEGRSLISPDARVFLASGFCGGFTTFSAFSLQTLELMRQAEWLGAAINIGASVVLCLLAVWIGFAAGGLASR